MHEVWDAIRPRGNVVDWISIVGFSSLYLKAYLSFLAYHEEDIEVARYT